MERARLSADLRMRRHAADFVRDVTARSRLPLDYSVASLRVVDFVVDGLRKSGRDRAAVGHVLFGLGVYAGEVLVRRAGAVWVEFDEGRRELFGQPVGVRMPDGRLWNPLGKVVKRFEVGERESLRTFYLQLHGRARPGLPGLPAQPGAAEAGGTDGTSRIGGTGGTGDRAGRGADRRTAHGTDRGAVRDADRGTARRAGRGTGRTAAGSSDGL